MNNRKSKCKKLILVLLVVQIFIYTSCQNQDTYRVKEVVQPQNELEQSNTKNENNNEFKEDKEIEDQNEPNIENQHELLEAEQETNLDEEDLENINYINSWDINSEDLRAVVKYEVPEYTPNVSEYTVEPDLSNVYNLAQFEGFTENQKKSLYENGFVVLKPGKYPDIKMHHLYESSEYDYIPMFITVDSALNMYHLFFNDSLKYIEANSLYDELCKFTKNMLSKSLRYYNDEKYNGLKEELETITVYFAVSNTLLGQETIVPNEVQSLADKELALINEAKQLIKSPLLQYDLDYTQYTVRGHYTGNEKLESYFRAMMWYGNTAFPLTEVKKDEEVLKVDSTVKALIMSSLILEDIEEQSDLKSWEDVYYITALYAGNSDDLNVLDYREMITNVYGKNPDILIYKDETYYSKLLEEAKKLSEPQIVNKAVSYNMPSNRQFRMMGQRYTMDGDIMQNLMKPFKRPVPSGLDVAAAFGNERAEKILDQYYKPKELWCEYETELNKLKDQIINTSEDAWKSNLYSGWLCTLKSTGVSFENTEGMPQFMRSQMWTDKNINSMLGSYAELKHDTVLYSKQPCAEMGGYEPPLAPYHYVEPNVDVYSKLLWQAKSTKENLRVKGLLNGKIAEILDDMIEMEEILITCSIKELNNELLTEEEYDKLGYYGGLIDSITVSLEYMMQDAGIDCEKSYTTALVSDVATVFGGGYLELGTGFPCEIYVLCNFNGVPYIAKGAVYSYYEFMFGERLTDEKWHEMLGLKRERNEDFEDYDFYNVTLEEPLDTLPDMPEWTKSFISDEENNVKINRDVEIDWKH